MSTLVYEFASANVPIPTVENRTNEEFTNVCAVKTVPAIDDNGFKLFERYSYLRGHTVMNFNLHLTRRRSFTSVDLILIF